MNQPATETNVYIQLDAMALALKLAKQQEDNAKAQRIAIEEKIISIVGVKEEGSETFKTDHHKITTTGGVSRKLDVKKYESEIKGLIPEKLQPVIYKPTLNDSLVKHLRNNEPDLYALMSQCMTTTPRKAAVKIVDIES